MAKDEDGNIITAPPPGVIEENPHTVTRTKVRMPHMYHVIMLNDDFTPMDFVVRVLRDIFHHGLEAATTIMLEIHTKGKSITGTYSMEVATQKIDDTMTYAKKNGYPLRCVLEQA